jgi:hypothetical protein
MRKATHTIEPPKSANRQRVWWPLQRAASKTVASGLGRTRSLATAQARPRRPPRSWPTEQSMRGSGGAPGREIEPPGVDLRRACRRIQGALNSVQNPAFTYAGLRPQAPGMGSTVCVLLGRKRSPATPKTPSESGPRRATASATVRSSRSRLCTGRRARSQSPRRAPRPVPKTHASPRMGASC